MACQVRKEKGMTLLIKWMMIIYFVIIIGNLKMEIFRYEKDARSIPVTGEQNGVIGIGPNTSFSVRDGMLYLADPDAQDGTVPVGTHMQYTVNIN